MGAYLSTPVTDKESEAGGDAKYLFGVCAMQGWRTDMEDSHIVNLDVDDAQKGQVALFGVFDGHGGKEVAKFCAAVSCSTSPSAIVAAALDRMRMTGIDPGSVIN